MKERYTMAELRRRFDAVYYLPGKYCQLRGVLGEGSGFMDRVEGWACDVYDDAGRVGLTYGDDPKGERLPDRFADAWEKRADRVRNSSDYRDKFKKSKRLRGAFFRALARFADK